MSRKIIGVTVGTQLPKPNFEQTDPTKGDYIKNKPDFEGLSNKVDNIGELVGNTPVDEQISAAIEAANTDIDSKLNGKADIIDGKVPLSQLPDDVGGLKEVDWEDITGKPFGSTTNNTIILENQTITTMDFTEELEIPAYGIMLELNNLPTSIKEWWNKIHFSYDGVEYDLTKRYSEDAHVHFFGNGGLIGFSEDTSEPFLFWVATDSDDDTVVAYALITNDNQATNHDISISIQTEVVKTLDPKYIADMYYDTRVIAKYSYVENPTPISFDCAAINLSFYKISDLVLTKEEVFGSKFTINGREIDKFAENDILIETDELLAVQDTSVSNGNGYGFCFCNTVGTCNLALMGYSLSVDVPEVGIYRAYSLNGGMSDIDTIEIVVGGELKTLDLKYLPENMALGYETGKMSTFDKSKTPNPPSFPFVETGNTFYKVSDLTFTKDEVLGDFIITTNNVDGRTYNYTVDNESYIVFDEPRGMTLSFGSGGMYIIAREAGELTFDLTAIFGVSVTLNIPETGTYTSNFDYINAVKITSSYELKTIDPKFIPANLDFDLSDYYTKIESNNRYYDRDTVYTKDEVNTIVYNAKPDLSGYYTKSEVDTAINNIDLTNYYTKAQSDNQYYTKSEIDTAIANNNQSYYTKSEIDNNHYVKSEVYTKSEIDDVIGDVSAILDEINALIGE